MEKEYIQRVINLTPLTLNVVSLDGEVVVMPSEGVARVVTLTEEVSSICGFAVSKSTFGKVEGLPEPQDHTYYVVSRLVLQALPERNDLLFPGELVRDAEGNVIGCKGLSI